MPGPEGGQGRNEEGKAHGEAGGREQLEPGRGGTCCQEGAPALPPEMGICPLAHSFPIVSGHNLHLHDAWPGSVQGQSQPLRAAAPKGKVILETLQNGHFHGSKPMKYQPFHPVCPYHVQATAYKCLLSLQNFPSVILIYLKGEKNSFLPLIPPSPHKLNIL